MLSGNWPVAVFSVPLVDRLDGSSESTRGSLALYHPCAPSRQRPVVREPEQIERFRSILSGHFGVVRA